MTTFKKISAVAAVLALAVAVGFVIPVGAQPSATHNVDVTITPNSDPTQPPTVTPDSATVGAHDQINWTCSTGCDFTVVFTESYRKPFKNRAFDNSHSKSGRPTGPPGQYKYSVIVGEGVADPIIIVQ
jgi:hypothetical protein